MPSDTEENGNSGTPLVQINANIDQVVEKLTGGLLEEAFGMGKDWLRAQRLRLLTDRLEGAAEMCRDAGIDDPAQVTLNTLAPWIEGASIEDDPTLHEMWEALLANEGDPRDGRKQTHRSFVRILKRLEAPELKTLKVLYKRSESDPLRMPSYLDNWQIQRALKDAKLEVSMSEERLNLAKTILTRHGLCVSMNRTQKLELKESRYTRDSDPDYPLSNVSIQSGGGAGPDVVPRPGEPKEGPHRIAISNFGRDFYEACQPPDLDEEVEDGSLSE